MLVSPQDALLVINQLSRIQRQGGPDELGERANRLDYYFDVSGDELITPIDALLVINTLARTNRQGPKELRRIEGEADIAPAGFISIAMGRLPGDGSLNVDLATQMTIGGEEFNELGFFVMDGANGAVEGVMPSSSSYAATVFAQAERQVGYSRLDIARTSKSLTFKGGQYVGVYVLQASTDNGNASDHLRVKPTGTNQLQIGWEKHVSTTSQSNGWAIVGDRGYDDVTVSVRMGEPYDGNAAPVIQNIPNQTIDEESTLSIQTVAMDPDLPDDRLTFTIQNGPAGATIDPFSGLFRWTPTEAQGPGSFDVVIRATDVAGEFDTEAFTIDVNEINQAPLVTPFTAEQVNEETEIIVLTQATDPDLPTNTLTYSLVSAPRGATIDPATGRFRWTPTEADGPGTVAFAVRVNDGRGGSDDLPFAITVNEVNRPPLLAQIADQQVNEETELTVQVMATDPDLPANQLIYSLDQAPTGAIIDPETGRFRWTPTEVQGPGTFEIIIRATDQGGLFDTEAFTINVSEVNQPPVLAPIADVSVDPGSVLAFQASATDADSPAQTLTYSLLPGAPSGATINPSTGEFRWDVPASHSSGSLTVSVRVTDNGSPALPDTKSFNITTGCASGSDPSEWTAFESGGVAPNRGEVVTNACSILITEGNSFVTGIQRDFEVPADPSAIRLSFSSLNFDPSSSNFIRDAFEVAVVDESGNTLVRPFEDGRDAVFNITEGLAPRSVGGVAVSSNEIRVGLGGLPSGTKGKVIVRLINQDQDENSSISIDSFEIVPSELPAVPPGGRSSETLLRSIELSTGTSISSPGFVALGIDNQYTTSTGSTVFNSDGTPVSVFPDFEDVSTLTLNGDASPRDTVDGRVLRLANASSFSSGSAFSQQQINAADFRACGKN